MAQINWFAVSVGWLVQITYFMEGQQGTCKERTAGMKSQ